MHLSFFEPIAPPEHDLRSSASVSSSNGPRHASSPCTPPTRAFVVHRVSPFSGPGSSRRFDPGFRIVVVPPSLVSAHHLRASQLREPPKSCNAQLRGLQAPAGVSGGPNSCEPHVGTGSRVLLGPCYAVTEPTSFTRLPNPGVQWTRYARH